MNMKGKPFIYKRKMRGKPFIAKARDPMVTAPTLTDLSMSEALPIPCCKAKKYWQKILIKI